MKQWIALALFTALSSFSTDVFAQLCDDCRKKVMIMAIGKCKECGKMTSSKSYKYCMECAKKKGVCPCCGKKMKMTKRPTMAVDNNAFAIDLYNQLKSKDGNLFVSPYGISITLAMIYGGARTNTAAEIAKSFHFASSRKVLHNSFKTLNAQLVANATKSGQKLSIANGLCLTGGDVSKEFKILLKENYKAELFTGDLEKINGWVKKKTEGKIEKILDELNPNSVCVLLNAIYFKGQWEKRFDKKYTSRAPFTVSSKQKVKVQMMYQKNNFKLLAKNDFHAVSISYKGKRTSMVVLLPNTIDGLAKLEKRITTKQLKLWMTELDKQRLDTIMLFLPKFKLETSYDLVPTCKAMGIADAFDVSKADFSGMGWAKGKLAISQIKHKAFVEVNEEGTEAAAATAGDMQSLSIDPTFRANHPFLFFIRDNQTGTILFIGRVIDPS